MDIFSGLDFDCDFASFNQFVNGSTPLFTQPPTPLNFHVFEQPDTEVDVRSMTPMHLPRPVAEQAVMPELTQELINQSLLAHLETRQPRPVLDRPEPTGDSKPADDAVVAEQPRRDSASDSRDLQPSKGNAVLVISQGEYDEYIRIASETQAVRTPVVLNLNLVSFAVCTGAQMPGVSPHVYAQNELVCPLPPASFSGEGVFLCHFRLASLCSWFNGLRRTSSVPSALCHFDDSPTSACVCLFLR